MGIDPDVQLLIDAIHAELNVQSEQLNSLSDVMTTIILSPSPEVQSALGSFVVALNAKILALDNAPSLELVTKLNDLLTAYTPPVEPTSTEGTA